MLIFSRYEGEKFLIGDDVVIEVLSVRPDGRVRLGITAPAHIAVNREEIYESMKRVKVKK